MKDGASTKKKKKKIIINPDMTNFIDNKEIYQSYLQFYNLRDKTFAMLQCMAKCDLG